MSIILAIKRDNEGQRHREEQFEQPHLNELGDTGSDPVKRQHTLPDEPKDTHGRAPQRAGNANDQDFRVCRRADQLTRNLLLIGG
ncbi:hypothetical protein [Mycobacterium simulans]|uniref:hypothetical protein n=1 Tax=Mycobacterium simulans TaxID=627089 RepID=UPI001CD7B08D|nr:hypothetical protein [Mycobacterium simulans]